jgi:hypothetical protein
MFTVHSGALSVHGCVGGAAWGSAIFTDGTFTLAGNVTATQFNGAYYAIGGDATSHLVFFGSNAPTIGWSDVGGISQACTGGVVTAQNSSVILAFPITASPTSYAYATDPINVSPLAKSASFLAASGETPRGLAWSAADQLFVLVTYASDSKMRTYQSVDGIAWSLVSTVSLVATPNGLAATASGCLVTEGTGAKSSLIYSVDAGASWHLAAPTLAAGSSLTPGKVAASNVGFLALTNGAMRFSHGAGLSPALT